MSSRIARSSAVLLAVLILLVAAVAPALPPNPGQQFLTRIEADRTAGRLTAEEALLYKIYYGFDPAQLPPEYRPATFSPLKNGTSIVWEFIRLKDQLSPETVAVVEGYLRQFQDSAAGKAAYISPGGFFQLNYSTTGGDAVPATDVDPANGIPDYVERIAEYCDNSQNLECNVLGFTTPPHSPYYQIYFEDMGYYGYTSPIGTYGSRITLHNDFLGFPPNDDPEGNQWGAAKVTVAHEFKHACQRAGSRWTEGGWVEVDATWAEEVVYDIVNDYYNYLPYGSPISSPTTSLDSGGSGSYEDCVWQLWMSETYGNQIIVDLWNWRISHQSQGMMDSYAQMLVNYGSTLTAGWPVFAAWNYATGAKAIPGFGYDEAADYPSSPNVATLTSYPASRNSTVAHLAAGFVRCLFFRPDPGTVDVLFDGADGSQVALTAVITKTDGAAVIEAIALDGGNDADVSLSVPRDQIEEVGFVISNSATGGSAMSWSLTVDQADVSAQPDIALSVTSVTKEMEEDEVDSESMEISNSGEAGSVLSYEISVQPTSPVKAGVDKSIAGSTLTTTTGSYIPGATADLVFTVTNASGDQEWLTDVALNFPSGIVVQSSGDFAGGTGGDMISNGATGDGALIWWHGDEGPPDNRGVVRGGESADATVQVSFDPGLDGDQTIAYTLTGDLSGSAPHTAAGSVVLTLYTGPSLTVTAPNGGELLAVGSGAVITWNSAGGLTDVKIDLSRDGGGSWEAITASTPDDGSHPWTVTGPPSENCLIRVSDPAETVSDASDAVFSIYQPVDWLTVAPTSGDLGQGESQILDLDFDATGLTHGTYVAYIVISHNAPGSPDVVPVNLTVIDPLTAVASVPGVLAIQGSYPNPFNPLTTISFTLPRGGAASLEVFDVTGRKVRTVWRGYLPEGDHALQWDGRDPMGRPVAAGAYFACLRSGERTAVTKMILAK